MGLRRPSRLRPTRYNIRTLEGFRTSRDGAAAAEPPSPHAIQHPNPGRVPHLPRWGCGGRAAFAPTRYNIRTLEGFRTSRDGAAAAEPPSPRRDDRPRVTDAASEFRRARPRPGRVAVRARG